MDPSALFAPGGIVQGLSALGNSIGDGFKSYALIKQQRDDAEMARTKMLFQAKQDMADRDLRERQFAATREYQNQQQFTDAQRLFQEGRRTDAQIAEAQARQKETEQLFKEREQDYPLEQQKKKADIARTEAETKDISSRDARYRQIAEDTAATRKAVAEQAARARLQSTLQKYDVDLGKIDEAQAKDMKSAELMANRPLSFVEQAAIRARYRDARTRLQQARQQAAASVSADAKSQGIDLFPDVPAGGGAPTGAGLWIPDASPGMAPPQDVRVPFRAQSQEDEDLENEQRMRRVFGDSPLMQGGGTF